MKTGPFYMQHVQAGGKMLEGGWGLCNGYTDAKTEHLAVRERVGLVDFSSMGNLDLKGEDAKTVLQKVCVNDMDKLITGKAIYSTVVNPNGGIIDDITVYMLAENHYMVVTSTACRFKTLNYILEHAHGLRVYITDITGSLGIMCLQGPNSLPLLNKICDAPIDDLKYFFFKWVRIADCNVLLSRTGFTGSRGYELYIGSEDCFEIWRVVMAAGEEFGLQLCGMQVGALSLPLEKGYLSPRELSETANPFELGLGWTVALDKNIPCVANAALKKIKENGPARKLVGFIMPDKSAKVEYGSTVTAGGREIGKVTTASMGWYLDKFIGMAYIESEYAHEGSPITVISDGQPVEVLVVNKVFYDPDRKYL